MIDDFRRFIITHKEIQTFTIIVARSKKQTWAKFIAQYFGVLKPNRKDYKIT